jgi:hypothetical protein
VSDRLSFLSCGRRLWTTAACLRDAVDSSNLVDSFLIVVVRLLMFSLSDKETEMDKDGVGLWGRMRRRAEEGRSRYLILIVVGVLSEQGAASMTGNIRLLRHKRVGYIFPFLCSYLVSQIKKYITNNVI